MWTSASPRACWAAGAVPVAVRPVVEQRLGVVLGAGDAGGGVGVPGGGDAEFSDEGGAGVDQVAAAVSAARRASLASMSGSEGRVGLGSGEVPAPGWVRVAVAVLSPLVGCGAGTGRLLLPAAKGHGAGERRPAAGRTRCPPRAALAARAAARRRPATWAGARALPRCGERRGSGPGRRGAVGRPGGVGGNGRKGRGVDEAGKAVASPGAATAATAATAAAAMPDGLADEITSPGGRVRRRARSPVSSPAAPGATTTLFASARAGQWAAGSPAALGATPQRYVGGSVLVATSGRHAHGATCLPG